MADSGIGDLDEQLQQVQLTDEDQLRIEQKKKVKYLSVTEVFIFQDSQTLHAFVPAFILVCYK
jgi:hypothetical protein